MAIINVGDIENNCDAMTIFRGGASLETPGSEALSKCLWELACEDDIFKLGS